MGILTIQTVQNGYHRRGWGLTWVRVRKAGGIALCRMLLVTNLDHFTFIHLRLKWYWKAPQYSSFSREDFVWKRYLLR